ncbi:MAG: hypothetical protein GY953_37675 [bacterium]|nr:hypothetical protein [bacterium]
MRHIKQLPAESGLEASRIEEETESVGGAGDENAGRDHRFHRASLAVVDCDGEAAGFFHRPEHQPVIDAIAQGGDAGGFALGTHVFHLLPSMARSL